MSQIARILLAGLRRRGLHVAVEPASDTEYRLVVEPRERLTEADREQIARHEADLIALVPYDPPLVDRNGPGPGYFFRPPHWSAEREEEP